MELGSVISVTFAQMAKKDRLTLEDSLLILLVSC